MLREDSSTASPSSFCLSTEQQLSKSGAQAREPVTGGGIGRKRRREGDESITRPTFAPALGRAVLVLLPVSHLVAVGRRSAGPARAGNGPIWAVTEREREES